ncbi:MAG: hypothetical protein P8046_13460, partial [Anaerolineales bacterium]
MIKIVLIQDLNLFQDLKEEWSELTKVSDHINANLTWEWVNVWLKYFRNEGQLWILLARDEQTQKLVGIAPLFKTKVKDKLYLSYRQIGFIGSTHHHEYLNFIVQKGLEQEVIPKFIEFLQSQKHAWDTLQFSGIK